MQPPPSPLNEPEFTKNAESSKINKTTISFEKSSSLVKMSKSLYVRGGNFVTNNILFYDIHVPNEI